MPCLVTGGRIRDLPVSSEHALATDTLLSLHKDPFDQILVAQATVEGMALLTFNPAVPRYEGPMRKV
jgi:PIN domain nuclease of toxin-antitoxin system